MQDLSWAGPWDPGNWVGRLDFSVPKANDEAMGAMQRRKGVKWEQEVARRFAAAGWDGSKRGIGQPRAGNEVPDVDVPTLWPECKHGQKTNPRGALAQAIEASNGSGRVPVAVTRDNGAEPIVTLRLDDFLELVPPPRDRAPDGDSGGGEAPP